MWIKFSLMRLLVWFLSLDWTMTETDLLRSAVQLPVSYKGICSTCHLLTIDPNTIMSIGRLIWCFNRIPRWSRSPWTNICYLYGDSRTGTALRPDSAGVLLALLGKSKLLLVVPANWYGEKALAGSTAAHQGQSPCCIKIQHLEKDTTSGTKSVISVITELCLWKHMVIFQNPSDFSTFSKWIKWGCER